jgi:hypothetical protein
MLLCVNSYRTHFHVLYSKLLMYLELLFISCTLSSTHYFRHQMK